MATTKVHYRAKAHVTGGRRHGHGRTDDGLLEVDLRPPPELGGDGTGTNPEQLFAVGYRRASRGPSAQPPGAPGRPTSPTTRRSTRA